jgi:hypothetical protein
MLHDFLDHAQRDTLESVHQALGVPMQRVGHHVVYFLAQSSGTIF